MIDLKNEKIKELGEQLIKRFILSEFGIVLSIFETERICSLNRFEFVKELNKIKKGGKNMIDLKNEIIKELIEDTKKNIEREILKSFEYKINVLNVGEPKDGKYLINICYIIKENEYKLPVDFAITTNIEILEEDYKKWCTEVK